MMHPRKLGYARSMVERRQQAASPCPNRNGTQIGSAQTFTLFCGTDIGGNVLESLAAFDLNTCVDLCSSFHPRCDGASFDGTTCQLKARLAPGAVRQNRRLDSAVGIFPSATSNCGTLGTTSRALDRNFDIRCGTVIAGFDLVQNFAPTLQDCMGQCAATTNCGAVSYDPSLDQGFKNCYLKTVVSDPSLVVADARVDTALLQGVGNALPGAGGAPAAGGGGAGVATIPLPTQALTGGGAVFFTPPVATGGAIIPIATTVSAPTLVTELVPPSGSPFPTLFFPGNSNTGAAATSSANAAAQDMGDGGSSNAWIAAPVVGSVAAIALIVLSFIMLKRRRLGNRSGTSSSNSSTDDLRPRKSTISRPMAISSLFTSWLPTSASRGNRGSGGSNSSRGRMGNFSEVTGKQPASRSSMRTSVTGLVRPGMAMGGGERLDDVEEGREKRESTPQYGLKDGKMELRNSMNGLGQNRWS
ncbi:hypothetical protein OQA88_2874 [Cercophora sp. LCS_1]